MGRPKKVQTETKPIEEQNGSPDRILMSKSNFHFEGDELICNSVKAIYSKYLEKCADIESDIYYHLPKLKEYAERCKHCTEFGVRIPTSTYAFLAAKPNRLVSYDIGRYPQVDEVEKLCLEEKQDFQFVLANVLEVEIEETDFLMIDTYHSYNQLKAELTKHAHKVKHYIVIHDWFTHKHKSENWYPGVADFMSCPEGLYPAVMEFLAENKDFSIDYETDENNGLIILKRN